MDSSSTKDCWPVDVYRYSRDKGYELYQVGKGSGENSTTDEERITAAPRRGCVEVRKLRLRINLFPKSEDRTKDERKLPRDEVCTTVVRRRDCLLLHKGDIGAIIFQFQSISNCTDFSDRLVELNARCSLNEKEERLSQKRKLKEVANVIDGEGYEDEKTEDDNSNDSDVADTKFAVQSQMIRLLHDSDFMSFVGQVEQSLMSNPDCEKMLEALEHPNDSYY